MFPDFHSIHECKSVYIHIPFCRKICPFCSFAVRQDHPRAHQDYIISVLKELDFVLGEKPEKSPTLESIYFGGGTPSRLTVEELEFLLQGIRKQCNITHDIEITLECNPEDVNQEIVQGWKKLGINRFSLGGQSFQDSLLNKLGRVHGSEQLRMAIHCFHQQKVKNWNLDLIFGIPSQRLNVFEKDLNAAISSQPQHLSLYALEVHDGTPFFYDSEVQKRKKNHSELDSDFFHKSFETLVSAGFEQYELSNYALPGFKSRSNLFVWNGSPYLGLGCGAHSFDGTYRWANFRSMRKYIDFINKEQPPRDFKEHLTKQQRASEILMLSLRRPEGLDYESWQVRFGINITSSSQREFEKLVQQNLISWEPPILKLTQKGLLLADAITTELMPKV